MPVAAKICGLSTPATLDAAVAGGADYVGFVFYPASPRHLALDRAAGLAGRMPAHVRRVGVFVDPDDALLDAAVAAGRLHAVQLHRVTAARRAAVRAAREIEVWGVIEVRRGADLAAIAQFGGADRVLFDAKTPDGVLPGGMGVRFDWRLLQDVRPPWPWGLAGGLDAGNVAEAIRVTGTPLVDVSSGVESEPGVKDVDKIAAFLKAVRQP